MKQDNKKKISLEEVPREEIEKSVQNLKDDINKIDIGFGEETNKLIRKKWIKEIDDIIIEEIGTEEEKKQLHIRQEKEKIEKEEYNVFKEEYDKAHRMNDRNSIKIYHTLIRDAGKFPNLVGMCYHGLINTSIHIKHFDEALDYCNQSIEFKKEQGEDYSYELSRIDFINMLTSNK